MNPSFPSALCGLVLVACTSSPPAPPPALPLPKSAFLGTISVLERVHASDAEFGPVLIRALESDYVDDIRAADDGVRVVLDVTTIGPDVGAAIERFDGLNERLQERLPPSSGRVYTRDRSRAALEGIGRSVWREVSEAAERDWLSYSDSIIVWVDPQRSSHAEPILDDSAAPADALAFVQEAARHPTVGIGELETFVRSETPRPGILRHHLEMRPLDLDARLSKEQIGAFLYRLEALSPIVKVTHIAVIRAHGVTGDDFGEDAWTFEAELLFQELDT